MTQVRPMGTTLGIMLTMTTYGTWLRGDRRGWVDRGIVMPPDPILEEADRQRMKHPPLLFPCDRLLEVGSFMLKSLRGRMGLRIWAMTVQTWHAHIVLAATDKPVGEVAKCAKDAVRWWLRWNRPLWSDDYDKRFCFDAQSVRSRIAYVERHNLAIGLPAKPWPEIEEPDYSDM